MIKKNTLHIFGGGVFVEYALNIAIKQNWKVVIRTGQRFLDDLDSIEQNKEVKLLSSNSLIEIMDSGGLPASGDVGISFSAPWIIPKNIIEKLRLCSKFCCSINGWPELAISPTLGGDKCSCCNESH